METKVIKTRCGGTVRLMMDCMPKTAEERKTREQAVWRACCEVLANAVAANGVEHTLHMMLHGPHADLIAGGAAQ